ncbi:MAG: Hsp33 family molecular chaperone HslO [Oscillospiraceae bacterium]|nr:Hsp33 family molecular chaperone HslO [Oscillospiraceae bacterium]
MDYISSAITHDGSIRVIAVDTTELVNEAQRLHQMSPVCCAALGRALTGASILGRMLKGYDDSVTLQINGGGPIGRVVAVSDGRSNVKGYVDNPLVELPLRADGKLDVGGAVGRDGMLSVIKDLNMKEPYVGQVPLVSGEIAEDLTQYFATSEQLPTAVALGVLVDRDYTVKAAGGFVIQLLPGAMEEDIERVEKAIAEIPAVTTLLSEGETPKSIVERLLAGYEIDYFEDMETKYLCDCGRERMARALISIGAKDLRQLIEEDGHAELTCHFCNSAYDFSKEELEELLKAAEDK